MLRTNQSYTMTALYHNIYGSLFVKNPTILRYTLLEIYCASKENISKYVARVRTYFTKLRNT